MTILDQIALYAKERVAKAEREMPLEEIKKKALSHPKGNFDFEIDL